MDGVPKEKRGLEWEKEGPNLTMRNKKRRGGRYPKKPKNQQKKTTEIGFGLLEKLVGQDEKDRMSPPQAYCCIIDGHFLLLLSVLPCCSRCSLCSELIGIYFKVVALQIIATRTPCDGENK